MLLTCAASLAVTGCNPLTPAFRETVTEGKQYARYVDFKGGFQSPNTPTYVSLVYFHFRTVPSKRDGLMVEACGRIIESGAEECSPTHYLIDTAKSYAVRKAKDSEWDEGVPVLGAYGGNEPHTDVKPTYIREIPPRTFEFRGNFYGRYESWFLYPSLLRSDDGRLVILGGLDGRRLPSGPLFLGRVMTTGSDGTYIKDFFDSRTGNKLASLQMDCGVPTSECAQYASIVSSRWVVFPLKRNLSRALVFDFSSGLSAEE